MSTNRLKFAGAGLLAAFALLLSGSAMASGLPPLNMPEGVTEISREVYGLHMMMLKICAVIGALVFVIMLTSIILHRKSRGVTPAKWHESTSVEIAWTVIPFAILVAVAIPATATLVKMEDTGGAEMTIKITGYQWNWHYDYLDHDIEFFSNLDADSTQAYQLGSDLSPLDVEHYLLNVDEPMVIPTGTRVRLLLTAGDVIHAWWVPEFALKKDAIPGFINEMWVNVEKPGIYRGQCAELCGRGHGFMPVVVVAKEPADFEAWVAERTGTE